MLSSGHIRCRRLAPATITFVFRQMSITYYSGSEPDVMPDVARHFRVSGKADAKIFSRALLARHSLKPMSGLLGHPGKCPGHFCVAAGGQPRAARRNFSARARPARAGFPECRGSGHGKCLVITRCLRPAKCRRELPVIIAGAKTQPSRQPVPSGRAFPSSQTGTSLALAGSAGIPPV